MSRYFNNLVSQQYAADCAKVEEVQKGPVREPQHVKMYLVTIGESKLAESMPDTQNFICKSGGIPYNDATHINGVPLPAGGTWEMDGYHAPNGFVYK